MHVYTYSIHSLDVLRLILSYFYLICAIPFVIIGLVKGGGSAPLFPFRGNTVHAKQKSRSIYIHCSLQLGL